MLRITGLTLARGAKRLLENAELTVFPGHKVGLVGPNGCGKSSLFALLRKQVTQDAGECDFPARWVLAHVKQETPQSTQSALEYTLDGDAELREVEELLAAADREHIDGVALAALHERFDHIGGYAARARASALLAGLGFSVEEAERPVATFSGGWRMRLNLAQALMCRSDLLLLDEPTNHLDLDAVMWLEDWLAQYPGTLLLITHDRDFLDAVVGSIVHLENKQLNSYSGNYSTFERTRAMQLALQQSAHARQQKQVAHLQAFIDRFRAKATKAKQAQSRIKTLERMELIAAAHVDSPFSFSFREPDAQPRQLLHLKEAELGYGADRPAILQGVEWRLFYGDKIGLLGPNGAGKSTLVKSLAGTLALRRGGRYEGQGLRIGYFAQHQIEQLRSDESPLQHLRRLDATSREQEFRNFLGGFDFRGNNADAPIAPFSGGEKARLALALLVWQRPNLLLLDEPTNHLDIEMREAVAEALQDFEGTLVVVAHDRHLLKATADQLWLVANGTLQEFDGDLDDYKLWSREYARQQARGGTSPVAPGAAVDRREQKRQEAQARQRLAVSRRPVEQEIAKLESRLKRLQNERTDVDAWLCGESAYAAENKARLQEKLKRQVELGREIDDTETRWLELQGQIEALGE